MLRCQECDSTRFRDSDGLKFCVDCGTQNQDYVEEQLDEEAFFASQGYAQHQIKTKVPVKVEEKVEEETLDVEEVVYEVVQVLLKKQLDVATTTLGLPLELKEIVRDLWLAWRCLGSDVHSQRHLSSDESDHDSDSGTGSESDGTHHGKKRKQKKHYNTKEHSSTTRPSRPSVSMTLPILYIGCIYARTGTAAYEVIRWVTTGVLPYFTEGQKHPKTMTLSAKARTRVLPQVLKAVMALQRIPETEWLYRTSVTMARMMELQVPTPNWHVLTPKLITLFHFPEPCTDLARAILMKSKFRVALGNQYLRPNNKKRAALPKSVAMPELLFCAAAVIALKLKYGIGDTVRTEADEVDGYSWHKWVKLVGRELLKKTDDVIPRTKNELRALSEQEKYIGFLDQLFPNRLPPSVAGLTDLFERAAESYRSSRMKDMELDDVSDPSSTEMADNAMHAKRGSARDLATTEDMDDEVFTMRPHLGPLATPVVVSRNPLPPEPPSPEDLPLPHKWHGHFTTVRQATESMSNEEAYQRTLRSWVQIPDSKMSQTKYLRNETAQMIPVNMSRKDKAQMTQEITYDVMARIALMARNRGLRDFDYWTTVKQHGLFEVEAAEAIVGELPPYRRYVQYKRLKGFSADSVAIETEFHTAYHFLLNVCATRIGCDPSNLAKAVELLELYSFGAK